MLLDSPFCVPPGKKVRLDKLPTNETGKFKDKSAAVRAAKKNLDQLDELQELLYAESKRSLLIVLQGMDTAGKDGTIDFVFSGVNPQGCSVTSFKAPTTNELARDYLWRVHANVPRRGMIGIFNRSHYEDVLVPPVMGWIDSKQTARRYRHIVEFERLLVEEGTSIVKCFLHISKDEQKERLVARQTDKAKWWKFNPSDIESRKRWDDYTKAYENMIEATSSDHAPWYIIPADRKWFRNYVISDLVLKAMKAIDPKLPKSEIDPRKFTIE